MIKSFLVDFSLIFYKKTEKMPVLNLFDLGEVELLARKLPRETVKEYLQDDTDMIAKMFAVLPLKKRN